MDVALGNKGGNNGTNVFAARAGNGSTFVQGVGNTHLSYLDSPNTTATLTYNIGSRNKYNSSSGQASYMNRPSNLADAYRLWTVSNIIVLEIAA